MVPAFVRFSLPVRRDTEERGRDLEQVLKQYIHLVKPAFEEFTLPVSNVVTNFIGRIKNKVTFHTPQTKKYADVIIPRGAENTGI